MKTHLEAIEDLNKSIEDFVATVWDTVTPTLLSILDWMNRHWI